MTVSGGGYTLIRKELLHHEIKALIASLMLDAPIMRMPLVPSAPGGVMVTVLPESDTLTLPDSAD